MCLDRFVLPLAANSLLEISRTVLSIKALFFGKCKWKKWVSFCAVASHILIVDLVIATIISYEPAAQIIISPNACLACSVEIKQ